MGVVTDLEARLNTARQERLIQESGGWRDYVRLTAPDMEAGFDETYGGRPSTFGNVATQMRQDRTAQRSARIYDGTAPYMLDRLCSGMESLVSPQSDTWHGLGFDDPFAGEPSPQEDEWLDLITEHMFSIRYAGRSGFSLANKSAIKSTCKIGTGCYYIEENSDLADIRQPIFYRYIPMYQIFLGCDDRGEDNEFFREYPLTAKQAVTKFKGKVSPKVKTEADDPKRCDNKYWFVHACVVRDNGTSSAQTIDKSKFESIHYEVDSKHICKSGGYFEFPLVVMRWDRDGIKPYASPPSASIMGTIKSLNLMARDQLTSSSISLRPPLAVHNQEQRINQNAGKINPGLIDDQGRPRFRAMNELANPAAAEAVIARLQGNVQEGLFGTLWQILLDSPGATATEVMVRAQEKGEMIGPFAANIQHGYARGVQRELAILGRRGAFQQGSPLAPPESIGDKEVGIKYTSPIDALRKGKTLQAIRVVHESVAAISQTNPEALDKFDADEALDTITDVADAPRKILRTDEEVAELRAQRAQQQQQAEQLAMAESMAKTAKDATPAVEALNGVAPA